MFFKDVIGQERLKRQLVHNFKQQRTGHAQLFYGSEGTGTVALSLAFARYILCTNRNDEDACGTCASCLKLNKLAHPDLHFFFPSAPNQEHKKEVSSKLFISQWRELLIDNPYFSYFQWLQKLGVENKQAIINAEDCNNIIRVLGMKSYESPYRIIYIYMVDKLFHAAAPKILKILEEPPQNTIFLMISDNKDKILNTILSRTQIMCIPPPGEQEIASGLTEKFGIDPQKARETSFLADGNVSEALKLCDRGEEQMADLESFRGWMRACFGNKQDDILEWVNDIASAGREKQRSFFLYGLNIFRMCLLQNYETQTLIRTGEQEREFIKKFAPYVNHRNIIQIVEAFNTAIVHLDRNANVRLLFTDLSFQLYRLMRSGTG